MVGVETGLSEPPICYIHLISIICLGGMREGRQVGEARQKFQRIQRKSPDNTKPNHKHCEELPNWTMHDTAVLLAPERATEATA